ncbi:competence protein CoiA family protein [Mesorhizobium sp. WSM3882]|uniref:competence protein CoiA n=1 Tax=Mesorhizobium sp. WSM3882 TaxID=2029407 RepID=UPI000BAFCDDA|nr:competence protein CoiA family protein [Mesorhizobium sp. WSM3882]PBB34332.1 hypothetical protein CK214_08470 [Mesorhizobium sp. WSM3882]
MMPLRCLRPQGESIQAFDLDDTEWALLRDENRRSRHLRVPCCNATVAMKVSSRGLRFFSHQSRGTCTTAPETEEHLLIKSLAVDAARRAGWAASTEVPGLSDNDESWIADVLAYKGKHRVAIEIQWSPQTAEETMRRQERYQRSGVRCLWLFRRPGYPISKELPAVCVGGDRQNGFQAKIPHASTMSLRGTDDATRWRQVLPLTSFLDAVFAQRFRFGIDAETSATVTVQSGSIWCWKCGAETRIITFIEVTVGPYKAQRTIHELPDNLVEQVVQKLPPGEQVGVIKPRFSRTVEHSYLSNGCFHCDALIGEFFEHDAWYSGPKVLATFPVKLSDGWREAIGSRDGWGVHPERL